MQSRENLLLIEIGKWTFLGAGVMGVFFSFGAWFLVPGAVDLNRIIVAGLFASLATNALMLSGILFRGSAEDGYGTIKSLFRTPPVVIMSVLLLSFILITATSPWWARH